ncbi:MAG: hypothetical protein J6X56_04160 [Ruminococcus sp.]|nr:hypothetical protein [Ruminococcus sp.]
MCKCRVCGKEFTVSTFYNDTDVCSYQCHTTEYWQNILNDTAIIIKGHCFHDLGAFVAGSVKRPPVVGFSGRKFRIRFNDGRELDTNNLWHDGRIPKELTTADNAEIIDGYIAKDFFS